MQNNDYKEQDLNVLAFVNTFTMWHYNTENTFEKIKSNGYFNDAHALLRAGDLIFVNSKDVNSSLWVVEVKDKTVTVTVTEKAENKMSDEQQKWTSPHGHAIASSETDKISKDALTYGTGFSMDGKRIDPKDVYLSPEAQLLAEAVKALRYIATGQCVKDGIYSRDVAQDFLAKIERN